MIWSGSSSGDDAEWFALLVTRLSMLTRAEGDVKMGSNEEVQLIWQKRVLGTRYNAFSGVLRVVLSA